jgi:DMATS type aromatic prenyltransferase
MRAMSSLHGNDGVPAGRSSFAPGDQDATDRCLRDLLHSRLQRLLSTLGQEHKLPSALRVADLLAQGWASASLARGPAWPSDITDDHSPFELSLAFSARGETARILTEPQDWQQPTATASWALAERIHERLAGEWGASLDSFRRVADLFEPRSGAPARFAVWHSAVLGEPEHPDFKVYLNPAVHGAAESSRLSSTALERLGLLSAWHQLSARALRRGGADTPLYLSLDLSSSSSARVKIYVAHHHATAREVAEVLSTCPGYPQERLASWITHLMAGPGPYRERPPLTCFAFCNGVLEPYSATLHLPVRGYGNDDFEIAGRAVALLTFPQRVRYLRVLTHLSDRPLDVGRGLQTYISLRNSPGKQAVTVYLAPEAYARPSARELTSEHDMLGQLPLGVVPKAGVSAPA